MSKKFSVSITESIVSGLAKEGVKYSELPRLAIRTGQKNGGDNCEVCDLLLVSSECSVGLSSSVSLTVLKSCIYHSSLRLQGQ